MSVIVDDHDPAIQYNPSGGWLSLGAPTEFMSTTRLATRAGATASFTFVGTSITVYGTVGPGGNASTIAFSVDASAPLTYSAPTVDSGALYHQAFFTSPILPEASHTLLITRDSSTKHNILFLDYILYTPVSSAEKTLFIDDAESQIKYAPNCWKTETSTQYFQYAVHVSQASGCSVSFSFEGMYANFLHTIPSLVLKEIPSHCMRP
ncbi:hypothetical protein C8R43DRAFT_873753 [Mycena crocata]|nr:hypothetical protein C8R43DRAFT_873635 [Mycena crocata]KAJ7174084.1 hypothetical protein C8R43DRAFT_873753 [Mycena crocata]